MAGFGLPGGAAPPPPPGGAAVVGVAVELDGIDRRESERDTSEIEKEILFIRRSYHSF